MANIYAIAFSVLGVILLHSCTLAWAAMLLPGPVARARQGLEARPVASFLIGLASSLVMAGLVIGFLLVRSRCLVWVSESLDYLADRLQFARFYNDAWIITNGLVWILAAPLLVGLIVGGAGFAQLFAARARPLMREDRPLLGLAWGSLCTSAAYFLPLVGWFVFLPVVGLMSIGAGICGIVSRSPLRATESRPAASPRREAVTS